MHEFEDGHTPTGGAVRYGFDVRQFPGYSWRGYAVFSKIQVKNKLSYNKCSESDEDVGKKAIS